MITISSRWCSPLPPSRSPQLVEFRWEGARIWAEQRGGKVGGARREGQAMGVAGFCGLLLLGAGPITSVFVIYTARKSFLVLLALAG